MNIYLCSTLRHLLFSLLKANASASEQHHIFMIADQQNINTDNFDLTNLPESINVYFIQREKIRLTLYKGIWGGLLKLAAMRNINTSPLVRKYVHNRLFTRNLKLDIPFSLDNKLFLYNDRNKISRLFRLAFSEYSMIEEGIANYRHLQLKTSEKFLDLFSTKKRQHRYFGDDHRCKEIYLLAPNKAPVALQKKIKEIDFIDDRFIIKYCYDFFKYQAKHNYSVIIATQPHVIDEFDLIIYKKLAHKLTQEKIPFAIKVHPREDIEYYKTVFPTLTLIESKIPLELIIFGSLEKCKILSICTSSGTGFEKYCTRLNLINDDELDSIGDIFDGLVTDHKLIDKRIEHLFVNDPFLNR